MSLETLALERFHSMAGLPAGCQLERQVLQGKLCLLVNCPTRDVANHLWRNQYQLIPPLKELGLADRAIVMHDGRVWHPAYHDS